MAEVGTYEAMARLCELLDRVEAGSSSSRHGRSMARLVGEPDCGRNNFEVDGVSAARLLATLDSRLAAEASSERLALVAPS